MLYFYVKNKDACSNVGLNTDINATMLMIGFPHLPVDILGVGECLRVYPLFQLPLLFVFAIMYKQAYGVQLPVEIVDGWCR